MSSDEPVGARNALLDAAWGLVSAQGADVSLAAIAKAAGVSRQAIYLHFGSRGGLLMALVKRADERFEIKQRLFAAFAASDPHERLDRVIAVWLDFVREILPVASDLVRLRSTDPEAAAAWEDRMSELRAWLAELVGSFRKDGALAPDWSVEEATDYLWAAISVQVWSLLTQDCGWAPERAEKAMQRAVRGALLRPQS